MSELKEYIVPCAQISFCDFDIVTASSFIPSGNGGGSGKPIESENPSMGVAPDDLDGGFGW